MNNAKNKKNKKSAGKRGFTLMELVVSVFIFSVVMISVVALFGRFVVYQKRARAIQQNMEDARYAMELMAKTMRTSSVVSSSASSIRVYDYSQGKCIEYSLVSSKINLASAGPAGIADKDACAGAILPSSVPMVGKSINNMTFIALPSTLSPSHVGQVTISMVICSKDSSCLGTDNDRANLQTTVSLRDYVESIPSNP